MIFHFKKQIQNNKINQNLTLFNSINNIAAALHHKNSPNFKPDEFSITQNALMQILKFYKIKPPISLSTLKNRQNQINFIIKHSGLATQNIKLTPKWHINSTGPILATKINGNETTALLPSKLFGYYYINWINGKKIKINKKNEAIFKENAIVFYEALPKKPIKFLDIAIFLKKAINSFDLTFLIFISFSATILGLFTPRIVKFIFSSIVQIKNLKILLIIGLFLAITTIGEHFFQTIKTMLVKKIATKLTLKLEAATIIRVLNLPVNFFKQLNPNEIFTKINLLKNFCQNLFENSLKTWISCIFSLTYFLQIFYFTKNLVIPAIILITITFIFSTITAIARSNIGFKKMDAISKENATCLEIISGIEKIKLTGCEKYAYARWANKFAENAKISFNLPFVLKINKIILNSIKLLGIVVLYIVAAINKISPVNFVAFNIAFSTINDSFFKLANTALEIAQIKPMLKIMHPIFSSCPENDKQKQPLENLQGNLTINNLSFAYNKNCPKILKNLSIKITSKQSVAIVGPTGCGKSTLLRLLIGFETPMEGTIFFDGIDINSVDLTSVRKKIGLVTQNERLFNGNIFSNIAAHRNISLKQAWQAAQIAHIDCDIETMPMRMNTLITQEGNEFSSGQVQQILIARAVATKPKILIFDDAMSTLSNKMQIKILKAILQLNCTKIMFTNQTSTLKLFDQVVFLKNGEIIKTIQNAKQN